MDLAAASARSLWSLVSVPSALAVHSPDHESFSDDPDAAAGESGSPGESRPSSPTSTRYSAYYWNRPDDSGHSHAIDIGATESDATAQVASRLMRAVANEDGDDNDPAPDIGIGDIVAWFFPSLAHNAPLASDDGANPRPRAPPPQPDPSALTSPSRAPTPSSHSGNSPARQAALQALTRNYVARRTASGPALANHARRQPIRAGSTTSLASLASILLGASALRAMGNPSIWSALVKRLKNKYWLVALAVAMAALPFMGLISYVISLHVQHLYDRHLRTEWHRLYSSITAGTLESDEDDLSDRGNYPNDEDVDLDSARIRHGSPPRSFARHSDTFPPPLSHRRDIRQSDPLPRARMDRNRRSHFRSSASGAESDRRARGRPATRSSTYSQYTGEQPLPSPSLHSPRTDHDDSNADECDSPRSPTLSASGAPLAPPIAASIQPDDILQLTYELDHLRTLLAHEAAQEQMLRGEIATMREVLAGVLAQMRGLQEVQGRLLDAAAFASSSMSSPGSRTSSRSPLGAGRIHRRRQLSLSPVLGPVGESRALSVSPVRKVPSTLRLDLLTVPSHGEHMNSSPASPPSLVISAATPPQSSPREVPLASSSDTKDHPAASDAPTSDQAADAAALSRRQAVRTTLSKISDTQLKSYLVEAVLRGNCSNVRDVLEHVNERLGSEAEPKDAQSGFHQPLTNAQETTSASSLETAGVVSTVATAAVSTPDRQPVLVSASTMLPASPPTPPMSPSPRLSDVGRMDTPLSAAAVGPQPVTSTSLLSASPIPTSSPPSPMPGSMPLSPPMVKEPLLPTPPASSSSSVVSSPASAPRPTSNPVPSSPPSASKDPPSKRASTVTKSFTLHPPARYRVVAAPGRVPPPPTALFHGTGTSAESRTRPKTPAGRVSWHASSSSKSSESSVATVIGAPASSSSPAPLLATAARAAARRKARSDIGPRSS